MKLFEYLLDLLAVPKRVHHLESNLQKVHEEILKNRAELEKLQKAILKAFLE